MLLILELPVSNTGPKSAITATFHSLPQSIQGSSWIVVALPIIPSMPDRLRRLLPSDFHLHVVCISITWDGKVCTGFIWPMA
jgi:hypothetical protein